MPMASPRLSLLGEGCLPLAVRTPARRLTPGKGGRNGESKEGGREGEKKDRGKEGGGEGGLYLDLGADLKAHRPLRVTHDGPPNNTTYRLAKGGREGGRGGGREGEREGEREGGREGCDWIGLDWGVAVQYRRYLTPHVWMVGEQLPTVPAPPSPSGRASCGCAVGGREGGRGVGVGAGVCRSGSGRIGSQGGCWNGGNWE